MDGEGMEETGKQTKQNIIIGIFTIGTLIALICRLQFFLDPYDEVLNIYISFMTAVLDQKHLVDNWYIFSMGDLFNLPFVALFYQITGGTEGIVLFIRFVNLGYNLLLALFFSLSFGKYYGRVRCLFFGLVFVTFFPGGMYTVSYDSASMFFAMAAGILLLGAELRKDKGRFPFLFGAGVCHACMVYAYPVTLLVVLLLFVTITVIRIRSDHKKATDVIRYWLPYLLGCGLIFGIFLVYAFYVGPENLFFLRDRFSQDYLTDRGVGELAEIATEAKEAAENATQSSTADVAVSTVQQESALLAGLRVIGHKLYDMLNYMYIWNRQAIVPTLFLLLQWGYGLIRKPKWRLWLIPEVILVGFLTHLHLENIFWGVSAMYAYWFCWLPFLICYMEDREDRRRAVRLSWILGMTSLGTFLAIGFTSYYGGPKSHLGLFYGAIGTLMVMLLLIPKKQKTYGTLLLIMAVVCCNMFMAYVDHFKGTEISDSTYRMQSGVFKGMLTGEQDRKYEELKADLELTGAPKGSRMLLIHQDDYAALLDGEFIVHQSGMQGEELKLQKGMEPAELWETQYWPTVAILRKEDLQEYRNLKEKLFDQYYTLVTDEHAYYVYVREDT